eukprot:5221937-Amphidinium_carterae.1
MTLRRNSAWLATSAVGHSCVAPSGGGSPLVASTCESTAHVHDRSQCCSIDFPPGLGADV